MSAHSEGQVVCALTSSLTPMFFGKLTGRYFPLREWVSPSRLSLSGATLRDTGGRVSCILNLC